MRDVSFCVAQGELVGVVGPSGSGKTTLLHLMGTLDRPSSGHVRITGFDIALLSDRELAGLRATRIGFVFQQVLGASAMLVHATGATLMAILGVGLGSLIRSQLVGIIAIFIWALVVESLIGGLSTSVRPYLTLPRLPSLQVMLRVGTRG